MMAKVKRPCLGRRHHLDMMIVRGRGTEDAKRFWIALAAGLVMSNTQALAQAAAPIGYWTTADNGEGLIVGQDAQCSFQAAVGTGFGGDCTWQSTSGGGILAIWYSTIGGPAAVRGAWCGLVRVRSQSTGTFSIGASRRPL